MHRYAKLTPLLAPVLLLAACGSSGGGSIDASAGLGKSGAMIAFAKCMRTHGVPTFPDPGGQGRGGLQIQVSGAAGSGASMKVNGVAVAAPAFKAAMAACRKNLPNGGQPTPAQSAQIRAQALAMSKCMRSHGVPNFPDPSFQSGPGGGGALIRMGGGLNPDSPVFQAAQKACGSLLGPKGVGFQTKAGG